MGGIGFGGGGYGGDAHSVLNIGYGGGSYYDGSPSYFQSNPSTQVSYGGGPSIGGGIVGNQFTINSPFNYTGSSQLDPNRFTTITAVKPLFDATMDDQRAEFEKLQQYGYEEKPYTGPLYDPSKITPPGYLSPMDIYLSTYGRNASFSNPQQYYSAMDSSAARASATNQERYNTYQEQLNAARQAAETGVNQWKSQQEKLLDEAQTNRQVQENSPLAALINRNQTNQLPDLGVRMTDLIRASQGGDRPVSGYGPLQSDWKGKLKITDLSGLFGTSGGRVRGQRSARGMGYLDEAPVGDIGTAIHDPLGLIPSNPNYAPTFEELDLFNAPQPVPVYDETSNVVSMEYREPAESGYRNELANMYRDRMFGEREAAQRRELMGTDPRFDKYYEDANRLYYDKRPAAYRALGGV